MGAMESDRGAWCVGRGSEGQHTWPSIVLVVVLDPPLSQRALLRVGDDEPRLLDRRLSYQLAQLLERGGCATSRRRL